MGKWSLIWYILFFIITYVFYFNIVIYVKYHNFLIINVCIYNQHIKVVYVYNGIKQNVKWYTLFILCFLKFEIIIN